MPHALAALAVARDTLTKAAEKMQAAHDQHSALLVRKTEAEARVAEALRDVRDKKITEDVGALRMAQANEDASDLQVLIEQGAKLLAAVNEDLTNAQVLEREADCAARREEQEATATELSNHISTLKAVLNEALGERHQLYININPAVAAVELEKQIRQLEHELLAAVADRFRLNDAAGANPGNRYMFYKPNPALDELVRHGRKPGGF